MAPKEICERSLLDFSLGDAQHDLLKIAFARLDLGAVQVEEDKRCDGARPLVSIHEGVVLNDVKQIGGGQGVQILVEKLAAKGCGWHAYGGLQESQIPKTL